MANTNSLSLNPSGTSSAQYVYAPDSVSLSITGDLTLECWIKLGTLASQLVSNQTFIAKDINDGNISFRLFQSSTDDKMIFRWSSTGTTGVGLTTGTNNTVLSTNIWTHFAVVYYATGGSVLFYKDGIVDGTITGGGNSIYDGTAPVQLGAVNGLTSPVQYGVALMDEVRIWPSSRTAAQISANYNTEIGTTGLNAYWQLNNNYTDLTGNNNTLTAINSPIFSTDLPFGANAVSGLQSKYW